MKWANYEKSDAQEEYKDMVTLYQRHNDGSIFQYRETPSTGWQKDQEGIFAGPSCGASLHAALRVAATLERGKIVVILADGGWKYLSEDLWTRELDTLEDDLLE